MRFSFKETPKMQADTARKIEEQVVTGASWAAFCDHLKQAGQQILRAETPNNPLDRAEGFRYLSRLTRIALEMHVESGDVRFPTFYRPSHETAKIGADNPDNHYQRTEIDGSYDYRIRGNRGSVHYLGFVTLCGGYGKTGSNEQTGDIDHANLQLADDGSFEIIVSQTPHKGNWLAMTPETNTLLVRQTFLDRSNETLAEISIERLNCEGETPAPLTAVEFERGLSAAAGFVEGCARVFCDWAKGYLRHPNQLPAADQAVCQAAGGDPNIFYYHSYWELARDEALVIELDEIPECETWNFQLNNYWMESLDYRYHRISVNKHTARYESDGRVLIVVAARDTGVGNWIDSAGHGQGTMCFRWIRATHHPDPQCRVVKLDELAAPGSA